MENALPYPQSIHLFGHARAWYPFSHREDPRFEMPDHLDDQVFRIVFCRTLAGHYFEVLVSEQFPKGSYLHIGKALRCLGPQRFCVSILHGRNHGAHLLFWDGKGAQQFYHLDLDFTQMGQFDRGIVTHLASYDADVFERIFALLQGREMGEQFQLMLRKHLSVIKCKSTESYHALIDFVLKLVFLLFVQRKGWLNFDPFYLSNQMERCARKGISIVQALFRPMFAHLEGHDSKCLVPLGDLPRLGGGMFAFRHELLPLLSNGWCLELYQKLLSYFSFSLFEGDAQSKIVGIGPEILGHVFENLLDPDERKQTGTFFTPPEVAEKQVQAAFNAYFSASHVKDETDYLAALRSLRILDPACGSGTFLVAAYRQILARRLEAAPLRERYNGRLFALKREIVTTNLFGIDLNPMAVRLAEVRLWLHMIQDLEVGDPRAAPQLPSLQHHLRAGDFLSQFVPNRPDRARTWPKFPMLEKLRRKFPRASGNSRMGLLKHMQRLESELADYLIEREDAPKREALRQQFGQLVLPGLSTARHDGKGRGKLKLAARPGVGHHVLFCDVFLKGGFDLIVGNPPWLSAVQIGRERRQHISSWQPPTPGFRLNGRADLSLYFLAACLPRLREGGHLSFLIPGKFLSAAYAASLRNYLLREMRVDYLYDYGVDQRMLFKADTFPLVVGLTRAKPQAHDAIAVEVFSKQWSQTLTRLHADLADAGGNWILQRTLPALMSPERQQGMPLGERVRIQRGIVTNAKRWFVFDEKPAGFLPAHTKPLVRGRDIQPGRLTLKHWIYYPFESPEWSASLTKKETNWLKASRKCRLEGSNWRLPYSSRHFEEWLLVWPYLAPEWRVALLRKDDWVPDQTCYYIGFREFAEAYRYFAFFNSVEANQQLKRIADRGKDRFFFFYAKTCAQLMLPPDFERHPLSIPDQACDLMPQHGRNLWLPGCEMEEAS